jgi:prepilin-type N-terminal cleavage/methylation domain-containing protein
MNRKAFTLIELLVVVAIIGILAAVGVTTFNGFQEKAKITVVKQHFSAIIKKVALVSTQCGFENSVKLKKVWGDKTIYDVPCYDVSLMKFFQGSVSNDLYNSGVVVKDPYNNEGVWQRNGKSSSGYAPECKTDYRVGKVYAVYPSGTNNIEFCSCFKTPCTQDSNRLETTITAR